MLTIYETPEMLRLVPQILAIADDRTEADRAQSLRLLARYLEFAVPLMGFVDELETLSPNLIGRVALTRTPAISTASQPRRVLTQHVRWAPRSTRAATERSASPSNH